MTIMRDKSLNNILIIQTAYLGDVILATGLIEKINEHFPEATIDFLLRQGYESLFDKHPRINEVIVFEKHNRKLWNLLRLIKKVRTRKYDMVINVQRYYSSGLVTILSRSMLRVGFKKNPFSFLFDQKVSHDFDGSHEIERNHELIEWFTDNQPARPKLYPSVSNYKNIEKYTSRAYICVAPAAIWFTKQFPEAGWIELINSIGGDTDIYIIGGIEDEALGQRIGAGVTRQVKNLCGKLSLLDSAALMKGAIVNLVNDSAPLHIASSMDAPVAVIYCSTQPSLGFGPLSTTAEIIQIKDKLSCRPCSDHGLKSCPEGHFDCAMKIDLKPLIAYVNERINTSGKN